MAKTGTPQNTCPSVGRRMIDEFHFSGRKFSATLGLDLLIGKTVKESVGIVVFFSKKVKSLFCCKNEQDALRVSGDHRSVIFPKLFVLFLSNRLQLLGPKLRDGQIFYISGAKRMGER
ncbi:hypothetical protein [Leptospirillum ferriphilum]|uniref:Uncharacterized protein n=1 Tax=Leptospirillum ferriphilum YSK TaxID=1441628 RepID=A0A059Y2X8_9BACT|nr:hypothetical protein [Leptospirillum ferriphilum]AIA31837.1 hypothetical protein Y981_08695 [Leptospirillum ferriphilum YSK]